MDLFVNCNCGRRVPVTSAQAGNRVRCGCDQELAVPSLGQLRRMAGQAAYRVDIVEKLRYMFLEGELPAETTCVRCHITTQSTLGCTVECERTMVHGPGFWKTFFTTLLTPLFIWKHLEDQYRDREVLGNERMLRTPLRLCPTCATQIKSDPKEIRTLLRQSPLYDELFAEYPEATIAVSKSS